MSRTHTPTVMHWPPTVHEIWAAPELGILAALMALLEITANALFVAHPELGDDQDSRPLWRPLPAVVPVAGNILRDAARLRRAIDRYRRAITPPTASESSGSNDIPF